MASHSDCASQGVCDPAMLAHLALVQDPMTVLFDFDACKVHSGRFQGLTAQHNRTSIGADAPLPRGLDAPVPTSSPPFEVKAFLDFPPHAAVPPPSGTFDPLVLVRLQDELCLSQVNAGFPIITFPPDSQHRASSRSSTSSSNRHDAPLACHSGEDCEHTAISWSDLSLSDYLTSECTPAWQGRAGAQSDSSSVPGYVAPSSIRSSASTSACRPLKPRKSPCSSLPDKYQPIKLGPGAHPCIRCPMPNRGAELEDRDAAWRGHFKHKHHDDLCLMPGCRGNDPSKCIACCPLPAGGCMAPMMVESVGRHILNVHIKVAYGCPVCGKQSTWRESSCARHIRSCLKRLQAKETLGARG
ncbi:hypothetical protein BD311DRAFT_501705 [Dichomitus squalens]|uniref:Uncharacterized protein n=1 Tax=Dichomitus squalens TaxID=114155 RepID=A0A4Q9MDS5_9APHY|nr:hypothetical protein BD311DRAFT_501705 [Dichomitus squalens]